MNTNALLSIIGAIIISMLTLIISIQFELKREINKLWEVMTNKQDKAECIRQMDKQEKWMKELDDRKKRRIDS